MRKIKLSGVLKRINQKEWKMNISPICNINFGKTPVLKCKVKNAENNENCSATLYLMDYKNPKDKREVELSKYTYPIKNQFLSYTRDNQGYNFYVLKNDESDEVMGCAQTRRHFSGPDSRFPNTTYTIIETAGENKKYKDSFAPVTAQIAKDAKEHFDSHVSTAFRMDEDVDMTKYSFIETGLENMILREGQYDNLIDEILASSEAEFIG